MTFINVIRKFFTITKEIVFKTEVNKCSGHWYFYLLASMVTHLISIQDYKCKIVLRLFDRNIITVKDCICQV